MLTSSRFAALRQAMPNDISKIVFTSLVFLVYSE
jgi:hypothetical protein